MMGLLERESRCRHDYIRELEEERRKIEAFQRELPLCLQLVTQAIESVRQKMGCDDDDEEMRAKYSPVLEEFIPLKPSSSSEERSQAAEKKTTPDWLRSAQLWNQEPDTALKVEPPKKPIAVNLRKICGAFQPFEREKKAASSAATNGGVVGGDCNGSGGDEEKKKEKEGQSQPPLPHRKARRCWSPELHRRFINALHQLGGSHVATPKQIRELMKVDGLTNDEVKSHLQKYRLHTRGPALAVRSSGSSSPAPQYVLVGGILVPPPEHAAAAVTAAATAAMGLQQQRQERNENKYSSNRSVLERACSRYAADDDDDAAKSTSSATGFSTSQTNTSSSPL